jgi:hypothetical protein
VPSVNEPFHAGVMNRQLPTVITAVIERRGITGWEERSIQKMLDISIE